MFVCCISCILLVESTKAIFVRQNSYDSNKGFVTVGFISVHVMNKLLWRCAYILGRTCKALGELFKILGFFNSESGKNSEGPQGFRTIRIFFLWGRVLLCDSSWLKSLRSTQLYPPLLDICVPLFLHETLFLQCWTLSVGPSACYASTTELHYEYAGLELSNTVTNWNSNSE